MTNRFVNRCRPHPRSAFTLVELIAAVGILLILLIILLPSFYRARAYARQGICGSSNLHPLYSAMLLFSLDNNGHLPQAREGDTKAAIVASLPETSNNDNSRHQEVWWPSAIVPYLPANTKNPYIYYKCPEAVNKGVGTGGGGSDSPGQLSYEQYYGGTTALYIPGVRNLQIIMSYGFNCLPFPSVLGGAGNPVILDGNGNVLIRVTYDKAIGSRFLLTGVVGTGESARDTRLALLRQPAKSIMLGDNREEWGSLDLPAGTSLSDRNFINRYGKGWRHLWRRNYIFYDGHIEAQEIHEGPWQGTADFNSAWYGTP